METEVIHEIHTIKELPDILEIPDEMKQFGPDRKIRVFGLKNKEADELICVAIFLDKSPDESQIQLLHVYTEPSYRRQYFMEHLLDEVRSSLKSEGVESIFCKLVGYDLDELYIFGKLAEKTGFEPLTVEGFLLVYNLEKLNHSTIKEVEKLPTACMVKAITDLSVSEKAELENNEFIKKNNIKLKQSEDSKSQLLFIKDAKNDRTEPVIYIDAAYDPNGVLVFCFFEKRRSSKKDLRNIFAALLLNTLHKCIKEHKIKSEFRIVIVGNKRNEVTQNILGKATRQLRLQEYIMKL